MKDSEFLADIAADWWAEDIKNPKKDNGDSSIIGGVTMAIGMSAAGSVPDDGSVALFRKKLVSLLVEEINSSDDPIFIKCDYSPVGLLYAAAFTSGISKDRFSWKTKMKIAEDCIWVENGYGADTEVLWATREWLVKEIKKGKVGIEEYKELDCKAVAYFKKRFLYLESLLFKVDNNTAWKKIQGVRDGACI